MLDTVTGVQLSDLVDLTARRLSISREEAKVVVLEAATVVCAPPPVKVATIKVKTPSFQAMLAYTASA